MAALVGAPVAEAKGVALVAGVRAAAVARPARASNSLGTGREGRESNAEECTVTMGGGATFELKSVQRWLPYEKATRTRTRRGSARWLPY